MPRGPSARIDRPARIELWMPESLITKIRLELYSDVEGRVPFRKMSEIGVQLFTEWLKSRGIQ